MSRADKTRFGIDDHSITLLRSPLKELLASAFSLDIHEFSVEEAIRTVEKALGQWY